MGVRLQGVGCTLGEGGGGVATHQQLMNHCHVPLPLQPPTNSTGAKNLGYCEWPLSVIYEHSAMRHLEAGMYHQF